MTQLNTPLYTLAPGTAAQWQGNALDSSGCAWIVENEDGWSSTPPARSSQMDKTLGDGTWAGTGYYAGRLVTLSGTCVAPSHLAMLWAKEAIKSAIGPGDLVTLQVDELHLSRTAQVRLSDKIEIQDKGSIAFTWQMGLFAPDPRRYATMGQTLTTTLPPGSTTGRPYPRTYPVLYGGAGISASGSVVFTQAGNYKATPALVTIYGPVVTPQIQHTQTGRSLTFNMTVPYGAYLTVDLGAQAALLGGTSSQNSALTASSAWFMLVTGQNELRFRGAPGTPPAGVTASPYMQVTAASAWS